MYIGIGALVVMVIAASLALARKQRFAIWILVCGLVMFGLPFVVVYFQMWTGLQFTFPFHQLWFFGVITALAGGVGALVKLLRENAQ